LGSSVVQFLTQYLVGLQDIKLIVLLNHDWTRTEKSTMFNLFNFITGLAMFLIDVSGTENIVSDCLPLLADRAFTQSPNNSVIINKILNTRLMKESPITSEKKLAASVKSSESADRKVY
jgi:ABC-type siderophore export system fused ATPase/permease subunit